LKEHVVSRYTARVSLLDRARTVASCAPGLELLMLFGSRARREEHARSDWDFGYLGDHTLDVASLLAALVEAVGSDRVDLVDLARASGLLRFRAARDGMALFESRPRIMEVFCLDAADFWCDAEPILRRGYRDVLADLTRESVR
jgi:predicted nucleotidyltransferase